MFSQMRQEALRNFRRPSFVACLSLCHFCTLVMSVTYPVLECFQMLRVFDLCATEIAFGLLDFFVRGATRARDGTPLASYDTFAAVLTHSPARCADKGHVCPGARGYACRVPGGSGMWRWIVGDVGCAVRRSAFLQYRAPVHLSFNHVLLLRRSSRRRCRLPTNARGRSARSLMKLRTL